MQFIFFCFVLMQFMYSFQLFSLVIVFLSNFFLFLSLSLFTCLFQNCLLLSFLFFFFFVVSSQSVIFSFNCKMQCVSIVIQKRNCLVVSLYNLCIYVRKKPYRLPVFSLHFFLGILNSVSVLQPKAKMNLMKFHHNIHTCIICANVSLYLFIQMLNIKSMHCDVICFLFRSFLILHIYVSIFFFLSSFAYDLVADESII